MSFGFSVGDITALTGLAWRTVQRCRKAGSQHQELTDEVSSVHLVLQRFEREILAPNSTMHEIDDTYQEEIGKILRRCQRPLRDMDKILERYNGLENGPKNVRDLFQRFRFSSGEVGDLQQLRTTLTHQTNALTLYLNIILVGASGRVERQLNESGKELREMKAAVNGIAASLIMNAPKERSVLTSYTQDDGEVWKTFRREMISKGFKSSFLQKHESLIHAYLEELSNCGALDDPNVTNTPSENAHPCNEKLNIANAQPETSANRSDSQVSSPGAKNKHKNRDPQAQNGKDVKERVIKKTPPDHKAPIGSENSKHSRAPETSSSRLGKPLQVGSPGSKGGPRNIETQGKGSKDSKGVKIFWIKSTPPDPKAWTGSKKNIQNRAPETSLSRPENASRLQSMTGKESPLSIWSIPDSEEMVAPSWATEKYLSTWNGEIFLQLLRYRRTHAVSLSPFFTEPPYSFYLEFQSRESLDCDDSLDSARVPLQLTMNAPWAKPDFWLHSKGEALRSWQRWQRAHGTADERTYVETSQVFERYYLACPWGICLICKGYNVSLLLKDLEFVSRVVGHAEWQRLYCMAPEHRISWVSIDSQPDSVTRFLSGPSKWHVPTMEYLIWRLTECITSEEDVLPWAADYSMEGKEPPTIEDVHGLACLSYLSKTLTLGEKPSSAPEVKHFREDMASIAFHVERSTFGDSLARLVDLCVEVDIAHIQEKHSTTIPCRIEH